MMPAQPPGPISSPDSVPAKSKTEAPSPYRSVADSYSSAPMREPEPTHAYSGGPSRWRGLLVVSAVAAVLWGLATRVDPGIDEFVGKLGRLEITARLLERPEAFPNLGAYRYTYVLAYRILEVHRPDPQAKYPLRPGDTVFIGHYKPWLPRARIADSDWGDSPLGGRLDHFVAGEVHRLALDYELADLTPSGALDYCFPPGTNRFFALWTNPTTY